MGIGDPGKEQFRRAIVEFRNLHIVAAIGPLMIFRSQLLANDEFSTRGGVDTTTREHFVQQLLACDRMRRKVTYNPEDGDENVYELGNLIEEAVDPDNVLEISGIPFGGDDVQEAPSGMVQVSWALDGSDPNIPLNGQLNFRSPNALVILGAVDRAIVNWTRLESRFRGSFIYVMDSMRMYGLYVQILEFLTSFAGDENHVDIPAGVLPTEEPQGPEDSPNLKIEAANPSS